MARMRVKSAWLVAALMLLALATTSPSATALDQSAKPIILSLDAPVTEQSYPPLAVASAGAFVSVGRCKTLPTCDAIPITLTYPEKYLTLTRITVFFEHAEGANDLDVYFFQEEIKTNPDGTKTSTFTQIGSAASAGEPEQARFGDLNPSREDLKYWMTVVCFTGTSAYRVKGELFPAASAEYTSGSGALPRPRQIQEPAKPPAPKPDFSSSLPKVPEAETEKLPPVKEPGADGELVELPLVAIRGQAREETAPNRTPLIVATIALLALAGGTFAFFYIRSRRATEEPAV